MNFEIKKVATEGCEIKNENGEIIGWSVNSEYGELMVKAMRLYLESKEAA